MILHKIQFNQYYQIQKQIILLNSEQSLYVVYLHDYNILINCSINLLLIIKFYFKKSYIVIYSSIIFYTKIIKNNDQTFHDRSCIT